MILDLRTKTKIHSDVSWVDCECICVFPQHNPNETKIIFLKKTHTLTKKKWSDSKRTKGNDYVHW